MTRRDAPGHDLARPGARPVTPQRSSAT